MSKQELVSMIAQKNDIPKAQAEKAVNDVVSAIIDSLTETGQVSIGNFGTFLVVQTTAREGRNPQNGEKINIPSKRRIKFKPAKRLKENI